MPVARPLGEVGGERGEGSRAGPALFVALASPRTFALALGRPLPRRDLAHAVRDEVEKVQPSHPVRPEQLHRVGARLAHQGGQHVPDARLVFARALDVDDGGLQHAAEGEGRLRRPARAGRQLLHRLLEELGELLAQARDVGPGRLEDFLALRVVGGGEEQVFHRRGPRGAGPWPHGPPR